MVSAIKSIAVRKTDAVMAIIRTIIYFYVLVRYQYGAQMLHI